MDLSKIEAILQKYKLELLRQGDTITIICPKEPPSDVESKLKDYFKENNFDSNIIIGPKQATFAKLICTGINFLYERKGRKLTIWSSEDIDDNVWNYMTQALADDGYFDCAELKNANELIRSWEKVRAQTSIASPRNNKRDTAIGIDDLLNLKIVLNTVMDVKDFINNV